MSQYKIEKRTKYDTDGSIISTVWDVYHEDGQLAEGGLLSEEMAQGMLEVYESREELKKIKTPTPNKNEPNIK
ncbi:TPA: hypothetical protein ACSUN1_001632 [Salmonella enterica subsp. diarizonae]